MKEIFERAKKEFMVALFYMKAYMRIKVDGWRLDFAILMADAMQRAKNKRFYVVENGHHKLIWLCRGDVEAMKKPRYVTRLVKDKDGKRVVRHFKVRMMPKHTSHMDLMRDCLYYTPEYRNNSNGISVEERNKKRERWVGYLESYRMRRIKAGLRAG